MAKLSIKLQGRMEGGLDSKKHDGSRTASIEEPHVKLPRSKVKTLLANQKNVQDQGALMYPTDYIEKMHVRKANWLGRMERGRER